VRQSPSSEPDYRASLNARHRRRIGRAWFWIFALVLTCLVSSGLAGWTWILLFDDSPPWDLLGGALFLIEAPAFLWLARKGPLLPVPGRTPEEMAADAFFHDERRQR
jgi:hypothetical protein